MVRFVTHIDTMYVTKTVQEKGKGESSYKGLTFLQLIGINLV